MFKQLLLTATITLSITLALNAATGQEIKPASESEQTLLNKSETIALMNQVKSMSSQQQKEKINQVWVTDTNSKTPRSDFLYCSAFAYLNDYKAQACLARAFENGRGIGSNLTDAYVWYTIALEHSINDAALKSDIESGQARVKTMLLSVYPAPSDFELEEAVKKQKEKVEEYRAEAGH